MSPWKIGIIGIVGLVAVVGAVLGARWVLAPVTGAIQKREITTRGAYQIQGYEQFYRWQEEAGAIDAKLVAYAGRSDARSRTECIGLLAVRADIVAKYNAASQQVETQGQWKADNLPARMPQKERATCG